MANQLTKDLEIMFENYVEGFEAACVVSRQAKKFRPDDTAMQRAGDTVWRPQHYHMDIVEGLDLTAASQTELVQRQVPATFKEPQNILYTLDAREMRDPEHKTDAGRAAGQRLAAKIDYDTVVEASRWATNVKAVGDNSTGTKGKDLWDGAAELDADFTMIGVPMGITKRAFSTPTIIKIWRVSWRAAPTPPASTRRLGNVRRSLTWRLSTPTKWIRLDVSRLAPPQISPLRRLRITKSKQWTLLATCQ